MIDASKYADLVLLLVDAAFGFEMETFEFLNLLQVQGFPKVMGVLTHLDGKFPDAKAQKKTKKALKHRFWAEIYQGEIRDGHAGGFWLVCCKISLIWGALLLILRRFGCENACAACNGHVFAP